MKLLAAARKEQRAYKEHKGVGGNTGQFWIGHISQRQFKKYRDFGTETPYKNGIPFSRILLVYGLTLLHISMLQQGKRKSHCQKLLLQGLPSPLPQVLSMALMARRTLFLGPFPNLFVGIFKNVNNGRHTVDGQKSCTN